MSPKTAQDESLDAAPTDVSLPGMDSPRVTAAMPEGETASGPSVSRVAEEQPFSALIVDDTPIIQTLLCRALSAYPIECEVASSGREALERFENRLGAKRRYDLVCLDVGLPEMDGSVVLPLMRAAEGRLAASAPAYIVVLTGDNSEQTVKAMHVGGANAYFLKPLDSSAFVSHLWKVLSRKSTAGQVARPQAVWGQEDQDGNIERGK